MHPHLATSGFHLVHQLEVADLSPSLRVIAAGDCPRVTPEVVVADPPGLRVGEPEEPGCRLANGGVVTAGCSDIARPPGTGIRHHAGRRLLADEDHAGVGNGEHDVVAIDLSRAGRRRVGRRAGEADEKEKTDQKRSENPLPIDMVAHDIPPSPQIGVNPDRRATELGFSKCYSNVSEIFIEQFSIHPNVLFVKSAKLLV